MSTDDYDMMSRMSSCGTTPKDMIYDIPLGVPSLEKIATSNNPATSDPNLEERSYADEVTEMYNVMLSLRSLDEKSLSRLPFSTELSRLEDLVKEGDDAPPLGVSLDVLPRVNKNTQKLLAEITTFSMSLQRRQIQELVEQQKLVANELKKDSSWAKGYRTYVDNHGTMHVLENDLTNTRLGKLEHEFLMKILKAPRKHYIWKKAADIISSLVRPGETPLASEVLIILTKCLKATRQDQEKLDKLQNEKWNQSISMDEWLPHTICRILGENVEDGVPNCEGKLAIRFGEEAFMISQLLISMQDMEDQPEDSYMHKLLKHVSPFNLLIPMISLQQEDIEGEIEYLRKKVENMGGNQD